MSRLRHGPSAIVCPSRRYVDGWWAHEEQVGGALCRELAFICLSGLATGASWLCYYRALQDDLASVVVPIDKLSILATIAFSWLVFGEKLSRRSAGGLLLIVADTLRMVFMH